MQPCKSRLPDERINHCIRHFDFFLTTDSSECYWILTHKYHRPIYPMHMLDVVHAVADSVGMPKLRGKQLSTLLSQFCKHGEKIKKNQKKVRKTAKNN